MYITHVMVRRSKEDALATRNHLLDTAEHVFLQQGVAGTSLNDIATAAGTTRGAIYWHFRDKADLFNAMMDRVVMPLQGTLAREMGTGGQDPLPALKKGLRQALRQLATDPQTRRVFEVATHMVEYVDSLYEVRQRHLQMHNQAVADFRQVLLKSASARGVRLAVPAVLAAQGLHALIHGLIQNWLLEAGAFDLETAGAKLTDAYFCGIGLD
jgi:TetR/AcrR family acrAB operon transcriptional repressor